MCFLRLEDHNSFIVVKPMKMQDLSKSTRNPVSCGRDAPDKLIGAANRQSPAGTPEDSSKISAFVPQ